MLNNNRNTHYYCLLPQNLLFSFTLNNINKCIQGISRWAELSWKYHPKKYHCLVVRFQRSYRMVFETHELIGVTLITVIYAFNILFIFHCHKNCLLCGRQVLKKWYIYTPTSFVKRAISSTPSLSASLLSIRGRVISYRRRVIFFNMMIFFFLFIPPLLSPNRFKRSFTSQNWVSCFPRKGSWNFYALLNKGQFG